MRFLLFIFIFNPITLPANQAVDELLAAFQTRLESGDSIDELCDTLEDQEGEILDELAKALNKAWPGVRDRYLSSFTDTAKKGVAGDTSSKSKRVKELRAEFMSVYRLGEAQMKPQLKSKSMPAILELRQLLEPSPEELLEASSGETIALRQAALMLAQFRDATLEAAISTTPTDSMSTLLEQEKSIAKSVGDLPKEGLRTLAKNRRIGEKDDVPADEAAGIEECNRWRLYVGLNALELDPKLCEASRDHSKDMKELGFFAHQSPVAGKTTPWDRARNFGTTASGENIYAGDTNPSRANKGWFLSPGHHKNMFGAGHKRIGLGRTGGHWTQMFGR